MRYVSAAPRPQLAPFVECFWQLSGGGEGPSEPILPDGCLELVVQLGAPMRRAGAAGVQPLVFLCGQLTGPLLLEPTGALETFAIRFRPGGARPFFDGDFAPLADREAPLSDLWGRFAGELEGRLHDARRFAGRVAAAERLLLGRLETRRRDRRVENAVRAVLASRGRARIPDVAREAGLSERQLERLFLSGVGLSPKLFSRIVRFQRVVRLARRPEPVPWAETAARCGYADQAHLARDVQAFSGAPPGALREERAFTAPFVAEERLSALLDVGFVQDGKRKEKEIS